MMHFRILLTSIAMVLALFLLIQQQTDRFHNGRNTLGKQQVYVNDRLTDVLLKQKSKELFAEMKMLHLWTSKQQKEKIDQLEAVEKHSKQLVVEIFPEFPLTFHHNDMFMCGRSTIKLLILIFSDVHNQEGRQRIRQSWGALEMHTKYKYELRWKRVFITGYPLEKAGTDEKFITEVMHNDFLGVHSENWRTMQTMYGALYWALNGCSFENLLVVKDNMFVNIPAFYKLLHTAKKQERKLYVNTFALNKTHNKILKKSFMTFQENGAWLASHELLMKLLPEIRLFMTSKVEGTDSIIDEFIQKMSVNSMQVNNFISNNGTCHYDNTHFLSVEQTSECFYTMQEEYKQLMKNENLL